MAMYERVCELSDPMNQAIRQAQQGKDDADRVREETLISGAFPKDFDVCLRMRGWRQRINGPLFRAEIR